MDSANGVLSTVNSRSGTFSSCALLYFFAYNETSPRDSDVDEAFSKGKKIK